MFWECMTTLKTTSKGFLVHIKVSVEGMVMVLKSIAQHVPTTAKIIVVHFPREQAKKMIAVMVLWDIMIILMYGRIALSDFSKNPI